MGADQEQAMAALAMAARAAEDYRRGIAVAERTPTALYAEMMAAFAGPLPEAPGDAGAIIGDLVARATPGIRASTSPRFFGWVIGNSHPTGVAADWLVSAWGQNAGNILAAPAASAIEAVAAAWLLDLLGLPRESSVGFVTGATVANYVCLAAARSEVLRRAGWDLEADGMAGAPPIRILIGADAHATVHLGLRYLGFGTRQLVPIATDDMGRMRPDALETALAGGRGPTIVIAQSGQINTGASDPFAAIAPIARTRGAWLHVDGAFGMWAQAAPQRAHLTAGIELADSWGTDGHKWLQTPYDSGFAIVRDKAAHARAMAISASYLPAAGEAERDPSAYVPELSRRARGIPAWAMIRQLGRAGVAELVERNCRVAAAMAASIAEEPGVELVCPVELNQFMLRFGDSDDLTLATVARIQADGVAFMGSTQWRGRWALRCSVCSDATTDAEGAKAVEAVKAAWRAVRATHG